MRPINTFFAEMDAFVADNKGNKELEPFLDGLAATKAKLQKATNWLVEKGLENFDNAGAASTDYLHLFGLTCFAWMWGRMAKVSLEKIAEGSDDPIYAGKLVTGRYFLERWLPDADAHLAKIEAGAESMQATPSMDQSGLPVTGSSIQWTSERTFSLAPIRPERIR